MTKFRRYIVLGLVPGVVMLGAAGCGGSGESERAGGDGKSGSGYSSANDKPASDSDDGGAVSFTSPQDGEELTSDITAKVDIGDFEIDGDAVGKENEDGSGHIHFQLDGGKFDKLPYSETGALAKQLGVDGKYSPNVKPEISYKGLPEGEHTLKVFLVNNDHSDTGQEAEVTFTTSGDGGGIQAPQAGATVGQTMTVKVNLPDDFAIDAGNVGKANQDGKGHLHFQLDGGKFDKLPYSETGALAKQLGIDGKYSPNVKPSLTYKGLPKGEHQLTVFLVNNDHSNTDREYHTTFTVS